MEVVAAHPRSAGSTPFRDHDVREWSRLDTITGALERARLETDSWTASTSDACHRYGKVVDSRARTGADGSLQAQASRQLEVFQSRAAGARLQVVKTRTVSSSRWSGKGDALPIKGLGFEDLQLPLNTLDLSSQKSRASVGRSVNRRPPSRHIRPPTSSTFSNDLHSHIRSTHFAAATNLHRVSRLCHQIHESAVRNAFGQNSPGSSKRGSVDSSISGVEITEIEGSVTSNSDVTSHLNLGRAKSNSSEDIHQIPEKDSSTVKSVEDLEDLEQLQSWRRNSKVRRSLQFPKVSSPTEERTGIIEDLPETTVNVKRLRDELEKGRRLTAALRNNSISADLNTLDTIIQSISSASSLERSSIDDNLDDLEAEQENPSKKKRESFVTVESLQEVKGRLRRTSSPSSDIYSNETKSKDDESDDGIVTEPTDDTTAAANQTRVKSYVYGMENMLQNKKSMLGTGSLESRSKFTNGTSNHKNEDWYNRRKSYGFEKVHGPEEPTSISLKGKNVVESSTDSGICRSNEIMVVPTAKANNNNNIINNNNETNGRYNSDSESSDVENKYNAFNKPLNGINYGNVKKMTSIFSHQKDSKNSYYNRSSDELTKAWSRRPTSVKENEEWKKNELKSTTITIPIVKNNNVVDLSWTDEPEKEAKRHATGIVDAATNGIDRYRKISLVSNDLLDDESASNNRKAKKVEFCKTEVHFAAESGKVNIVETDEKPPPTQNFRRRRRNSGPISNYPEDFNKNGLPMLHFGDSSYEKTMFGINDEEELMEKKAPLNDDVPQRREQNRIPSAFSVVTVNTNHNDYSSNHNTADYSEDERRDLLMADNDNLKGILKNKPAKPKPYHLGETAPLGDFNSDEDSQKWGVMLRHVPTETPPIWKSTVTVHNSFQEIPPEELTTTTTISNSINDQPEFQKLLRNLRPTTKKPDYLSDNENRYSDSFANIRVVPAAKDNRRSSWSVADRVKLVDENQESKGYSTKVNFGDGEATVVQNDQSTWPRMENLSKDSKQILNKGLVVRIGRQDSASKHTVCSKMTTTRQNNNTTTTTKITIDLSPSPPTNDKQPFTYTKFKRSQNLHHSFKSTPLVLNTLKDQKEAVYKIPQQLEALRKLYEDVPSDDDGDSDADKEVQQLLSRVAEKELESDTSSVVSGSWSKMKAFKNFATEAGRSSFKEVKSKFDLKCDKDIKDNSQRLNPITDPITPRPTIATYNKYSIHSNGHSKFSPVVLRKSVPIATKTEPKELIPTTRTTANKLEETSSNTLLDSLSTLVNNNNNISTKRSMMNRHQSPTREFRNISDQKLQAKYVSENVVLRQPRKSEMTYFGVDVSPKISREVVQTAVIKREQKHLQKPDLLQHHKRSPSPTRKISKPRRPTPEKEKSSASPIYENLKPVYKVPMKSKYSSNRDFDSSILEELTKAADQILQAVNGYTSEDCQNRLSSDEEELRKPLDTISETKSWKNSNQDLKNQQRMRPTLASAAKMKVKRTSSTSSVESLCKDRRKPTSTERRTTTAPASKPSMTEKPKRKPTSEVVSTKASTKARRLQRASSREALLQSHGSSSEDLPTNIETSVRKPRLVKKTKSAQLTITNGLELKKPVRRSREEKVDSSKSEARILGSLSEIRHKTAISTITSTTEKSSRDRSKSRNDESKSKSHTKRESSNKGTVSSSSTRPAGGSSSTGSRAGHQQTYQSQRATLSSKDSGVTQHRISTANIKRCHRSETATRH